jgi:hypothetical protein
MDESWVSKIDPLFKGKQPKFWADKVFHLFANRTCRPKKGDLREIAVALYFLFCGDCIRRSQNDDYRTFSVPFQKWLDKLVLGSVEPKAAESSEEEQNRSSIGKTTVSDTQQVQAAAHKVTIDGRVSFVQFQRLYLRLPLEDLLTQRFLKDLYMSGTACFLHYGGPLFDIVASVQGNDGTYRALLVCVKAHHTFGRRDVDIEFNAMDQFRNDLASSEVISNACFMLVLIGSDVQTRESMPECTKDKLLVMIPSEDSFGCSRLVTDSTEQREKCEIHSSHNFLNSYEVASMDDTERVAFVTKCLRSSASAGSVHYLDAILKHGPNEAIGAAGDDED